MAFSSVCLDPTFPLLIRTSVILDLGLTLLQYNLMDTRSHLQRLSFQIRSHSQVPAVWTWLLKEQYSTQHTRPVSRFGAGVIHREHTQHLPSEAGDAFKTLKTGRFTSQMEKKSFLLGRRNNKVGGHLPWWTGSPPVLHGCSPLIHTRCTLSKPHQALPCPPDTLLGITGTYSAHRPTNPQSLRNGLRNKRICKYHSVPWNLWTLQCCFFFLVRRLPTFYEQL